MQHRRNWEFGPDSPWSILGGGSVQSGRDDVQTLTGRQQPDRSLFSSSYSFKKKRNPSIDCKMSYSQFGYTYPSSSQVRNTSFLHLLIYYYLLHYCSKYHGHILHNILNTSFAVSYNKVLAILFFELIFFIGLNECFVNCLITAVILMFRISQHLLPNHSSRVKC